LYRLKEEDTGIHKKKRNDEYNIVKRMIA